MSAADPAQTPAHPAAGQPATGMAAAPAPTAASRLPDGPVPGQPGSRAGVPPPSTWPYLMLALVVIVLDQVSKYLVIDHFEYGERLPVIPGFFDLTLLYNPGAAFSFLAGHDGWQRWFFALIAIVASGFFLYLIQTSRGRKVFSTALGLILGGAVGNLIDRLLLGHVTDFLLFYQEGSWHFPAFNLADAAITLGAILMIGEELLPLLRRRKSA